MSGGAVVVGGGSVGSDESVVCGGWVVVSDGGGVVSVGVVTDEVDVPGRRVLVVLLAGPVGGAGGGTGLPVFPVVEVVAPGGSELGLVVGPAPVVVVADGWVAPAGPPDPARSGGPGGWCGSWPGAIPTARPIAFPPATGALMMPSRIGAGIREVISTSVASVASVIKALTAPASRTLGILRAPHW